MAWILIKQGEPYSAIGGHREFQIDGTSDISNPSEEAQNAAPGSTARTGDYAHIYNKQNDGTWVDIMDNNQ